MLIQEEKDLMTELEAIWKDEELFWSQRSRVSWLKEGDKNTNFFHTSTVHRKQRNKIASLKDDQGNIIIQQEEIADHVSNHFQSHFTKSTPAPDTCILEDFPKLVTDEMNFDLCKPPTEEEIKSAVFDLGQNKSPGPDGFAGLFFRKFWTKIKGDLCTEVIDFFSSSIMPEGWNIALIPKVQSPESVCQFSLINCCNFRYKVISKIMTSRLKIWMSSLVLDTQTAFTGGRMIQDNIILVNEILHNFKNRRTSGNWDMMMKLDMRKAYDLVDWDCLEAILQAYSFDGKWRGWVSQCISTVSFSVLLNGNPTEYFSPTRGIPQGDPLSHFPFIIMSNALSFLIKKGVQKGDIQGIKLNQNCPTVSHCLFADDTVIFGKASMRENMLKTPLKEE
ncbi:unnamed protein product [Linum trigynum]|uniref:Reverse transcriptase domain-containing protein n=1 Tax=Linum trigynum TaxID=586398 RepID=A0AAV2EDP0_9ROSI